MRLAGMQSGGELAISSMVDTPSKKEQSPWKQAKTSCAR